MSNLYTGAYSMAGDWLKWVKGLARKPEVIRMAGMLGRDRREIAGILMEFWEWTDDVTDLRDDGHGYVQLGNIRGDVIDSLLGAPGFSAALTTVGWLIQREDALMLPHFERHNGEPAKLRARSTERKRNQRREAKKKEAADPAQIPLRLPARRRPESRDEAMQYAATHLPPWPEEEVRAWFAHRDGQGWERTSGAPILNWRSDLDSWCLGNARRQNPSASLEKTTSSSGKESVFALTNRIRAAEEQINKLRADSESCTYENSQKILKPEAKAKVKSLRQKIETWKRQIAEG